MTLMTRPSAPRAHHRRAPLGTDRLALTHSTTSDTRQRDRRSSPFVGGCDNRGELGGTGGASVCCCDLSRPRLYWLRGGAAFGACDLAASRFFTADGALFGRGLAAEADDGVVVVAVGGGSVAAGGVVG